MEKIIKDLISHSNNNYIFPFLWMRGEEEHVIREEMEKIFECGIRAVCVEARPHPDFAGPGWWHDLDIVMEEAKKRDMRVWVLDDAHFPTGYANGLLEKKYPNRKKTYINYNIVDVLGAQNEVTVHLTPMLRPKNSWLDIGKPIDKEEQKNNKLISVVAAKLVRDGIVNEWLIDLTEDVTEGFLTCILPEGTWRIYVVYETKTDGGNPAYINMIDEESVSTQLEAVYEPHFERYKEDFGKTFAGFFSDEPSFGNISGFDFDESIGRKDMPLPWSEEAKQMLIEELGDKWKEFLPFLWVNSEEKQRCVHARYTYMDIITRLYEKNFSNQLGRWCEKHNVEYIGHVVEDSDQHNRLGSGAGHFFRALGGQHMSGIDVIGGQIIFGGAGLERVNIAKGDGEFYHYSLGKLGSSLGHLDPKKNGRTMCELFGAYGWKLGVRDMKYILDHLIVRGINHLVPHAFSMHEYPDYDCPPHFYARGHNPQFKHFGHLMQYANRLCHIFNNGMHIAPVAVLYHGESEWTGDYMKMQKPARVLTENQIDFDFVSIDMLKDLDSYNGVVENNLLKINGEEFKCLVIPYSQYITKELATFIKNSVELEIFFIEGLPQGISNEINELAAEELLQATKSCKVIPLTSLAHELKARGIYDIRMKKLFKDLTYFRYFKENKNIFMFQNESADEIFSGEIELPIGDNAVVYNGLDNKFEKLEVKKENGKNSIFLELNPYQSCVVFESDKEVADSFVNYPPFSKLLKNCQEHIDLSSNWEYSLVKNKSYPNFERTRDMEKLVPISKENPTFAGIIKYEKSLELDKKPIIALLTFEYIYEAVELWINEEYVGMKICPSYEFDVSNYLRKGTNSIRVEVATTLDRDRLNHPEPPFIIWHDTLDPTGMYGSVTLSID
ncbi:sugar-binding domain-containing protein [Metabacillus halosaccharovorans]|uniref:sugar-binding domain-containing protein n=1 Tax=Metabacillus halosaccharovorans TaxID=930124 RepID=UPI001C1FFA69|nr:sugar-binding domain-containing protein [Metabacillus halosaccharovorans]MBU7591276.1 glycoside hydrolase family 2 [Metabacillus halosaccharovorans]